MAKTIRQAVTKWDDNGETPGEVVTKEITILFFSPTIKELKEDQAELERRATESPNDLMWASDRLIKRVHSIPVFGLGEGQANPLSIEWFDEQDLSNLNRLREAIDEALVPKVLPPTK